MKHASFFDRRHRYRHASPLAAAASRLLAAWRTALAAPADASEACLEIRVAK